MKAAVLHRPGGPDSLIMEEIPIPECGPGEVLIRVMACGVSGRDVAERNGTYRRDVVFPIVIGLEISGVVENVGANVTTLRIGDHVATKAFSSCGICADCRSGRETSCQYRRPVRGGYGEFCALPEDAVVAVPKSLPFEIACSLGPAAGVALNAVRDVARVMMGEIVLVTGASGGLGVPSIQLAKCAGARVLALTRGGQKADFLRSVGADELVVPDAEGRFAEAVRELTGERGVDVVIDNVGASVFWEAFQSLANHGRYAVVGQLHSERIQINLARIFFKRAQLLGVGSVSRVQLSDVSRLVAAGKIAPRIDRVVPLAEVARAHEIVEGGLAKGRVVLMADPSRRTAA